MRKKKKLGLTTTIFIALLLGVITGIALHSFLPTGYIRDTVIINGVLDLIGSGFIRGMQMLVVPLVFCSLVCGSMAIGDTKKLGKVGIYTILFYLVTTAIAITVSLLIANFLHPGRNLDMSSIAITEVKVSETTGVKDTILSIIPTNPFRALADGTMLAIIFFALFVGVLLAGMGKKSETLANIFSQGNDLMMNMTMAIMKAAPIGVFCLIAKTFGSLGYEAIAPMLKYIIVVFIALIIQCFGVYQVFLFVFTRLNPLRFIQKFFPVMAFAFSTATSNATIPLSIETLEEKLGVSRQISSFTIPLGATINMDGTAIMQGVAVVFVAEAFGILLEPIDYLTVILTATLASIGTAGVPGVGLITLSMVFHSVGLPVEGIGLIMGIDRIVDMARTAVNITGDAVCTTIVANKNGRLDRTIFGQNK
ncbi:MAG TPA: dicarboxylate/amino acid:cation symporter [Candidatus Fimimorpha faecalis]|uniref:Dicarboxylate/amino acid:cation symporter n=1 Tax=Candidatus Fimimorpha faecalis TaxID=2840824 RepID=A0A9D1EE58_9FIRM|nr:dicarboxylate/amino acid:cation symporter [Candidatus Fimimorpha faecalis]